MENSVSVTEKIKWLEMVFKEGKISKECYINTLKILEEEAVALERIELEENVRGILKKNPSADIKEGRLFIKLQCPKCHTAGSNRKEENEFHYLGKDGKGFLYFRCPNCKKHLKYETLTGRIEKRKFLIGFLPDPLRKFFR